VAAPTRYSVPTPELSVQVRRERAGVPRTTTDNPWRDLHPARIWPD
jgi:hypothetical protein